MSNILIGTEFTFRPTDKSEKEKFKFGCTDIENGRNIETAEKYIQNWIGIIQEDKNIQKYITPPIEIDDEKYKKHKIYRLMFKPRDKMFNVKIDTNDWKDWYIQFSLDPGCIELQITPKDIMFWRKYEPILDYLIFKTASRANLQPDASIEGGGGHISLSGKMALEGSDQKYQIYTLANIISLYTNKVKNSTSDTGAQLLQKCKDDDNAPLLQQKDYNQLIDMIENKGMASYADFVKIMNDNVYAYLSDNIWEQYEDKHVKRTALEKEYGKYYQAICIASMEALDDKSRIEFRRFDAQENVRELIEQVSALLEIVEEARAMAQNNKICRIE